MKEQCHSASAANLEASCSATLALSGHTGYNAPPRKTISQKRLPPWSTKKPVWGRFYRRKYECYKRALLG